MKASFLTTSVSMAHTGNGDPGFLSGACGAQVEFLQMSGLGRPSSPSADFPVATTIQTSAHPAPSVFPRGSGGRGWIQSPPFYETSWVCVCSP